MDIFTRWDWIKRNWPYVLEEADKLGLVFVGGTALNLVLFDEYRASEDLDLYNPDSKGPDNPDGRTEEWLAGALAEKLSEKGFEVKRSGSRQFYIGPNVKVDVFHDSTGFRKIRRLDKEGIRVPLFDMDTYAEMKMAALLCRTVYDPRDLVDVFVIHKRGKITLPMPDRECDILEHSFPSRVREIAATSMQGLLLFQTREQVESLPYGQFMDFKRWLVGWLQKFL